MVSAYVCTVRMWMQDGVCGLQVVVDAIDPTCIVSNCSSKTFDFGSVKEAELTDISIPLQLQIGVYAAHEQTCYLPTLYMPGALQHDVVFGCTLFRQQACQHSSMHLTPLP